MIFGRTDRQTDRETHKLDTKQITPLPYMDTGEILFKPHFFYLSDNHSSYFVALVTHIVTIGSQSEANKTFAPHGVVIDDLSGGEKALKMFILK